jgi:hypothetical protein
MTYIEEVGLFVSGVGGDQGSWVDVQIHLYCSSPLPPAPNIPHKNHNKKERKKEL